MKTLEKSCHCWADDQTIELSVEFNECPMQYFREGLVRIHHVSKTEFKCVSVAQNGLIIYIHIYGSRTTILMFTKKIYALPAAVLHLSDCTLCCWDIFLNNKWFFIEIKWYQWLETLISNVQCVPELSPNSSFVKIG